MTLENLLLALGLEPKDRLLRQRLASLACLSITSDSNQVEQGSVFVAVKGHKLDGHAFTKMAFNKGAELVVVENVPQEAKSLSSAFYEIENGLVLRVENTREFLDKALHVFYDEPSLEMICIGVTGTNGKTTVTHLIEHILSDQDLAVAVMGTIDHHIGTKKFQTSLTTPGPEVLHRRLREFVSAGAKALAMEVSSHALDQRRSDSVSFDVAVFTNLSRDHLDYHATMEDYFQTKQRLFDDVMWKSRKSHRVSVVNIDDDFGRRIRIAPQTEKITYGTKNSDVRFLILSRSLEFSEIEVSYKDAKYKILSHMVGDHNAYNIAAAFGVACALGLDLDAVAKSLSTFKGVAGRLERISNTRGLYIYVDYAHTDDALKNVLESLKNLRDHVSPSSKIYTVFGCGGDRDKGKRPMMANVAQTFSDCVVVTSDNPRTEDPLTIISDILGGFTPDYKSYSVKVEPDRQKAIELALKLSKPKDIILIAGKGHEDYQIIGKEKRHFSDVETVKEILG